MNNKSVKVYTFLNLIYSNLYDYNHVGFVTLHLPAGANKSSMIRFIYCFWQLYSYSYLFKKNL